MRASLVGRRLGQATLLAAALTGLVVGAYFIEQSMMSLVLFSSIVGNHNIVEDSAKNGRGDDVTSTTEASGRSQDPDKTVIRLRRAHDWFSTTLVETESFGVHTDLKWTNEALLDVTLDFGCLTHMTRPVETVGPIRVFYHFRDGDKALSTGCPD